MNHSEEIKNELLQRLKSLSETVTDSFNDFSKGKGVFVTESTATARMSLCESCDAFNSKTTQCRKCGCFMSAKTKLKHGSCPVGKWGKDV
jgi:ribosomal protein L40E